MHEVRVHPNFGEGTRWWAEDDLGFCGGAEKLGVLMRSIQQYAEDEGLLDYLQVSIVDSATEVQEADGEASEPLSSQADIVRVQLEVTTAV